MPLVLLLCAPRCHARRPCGQDRPGIAVGLHHPAGAGHRRGRLCGGGASFRNGWAAAQGQQTQRRIANTLNPEKRYRELSDAVEIADTIANRVALAEECLRSEKFEEAQAPFRGDPRAADGRRAGLHGRQGARAIRPRPGRRDGRDLDELRAALAGLSVGRGAPALCACARISGRSEEALDRVPGAVGLFRRRRGAGALRACCWRESAARARPRRGFREVLTQLRRSPAHVRKAQAEWIALAEKIVRA